MTSLVIPSRYCGPPSSGNGGWTSGALAGRLPDPLGRPITVRLRTPPPLDTELTLTGDGQLMDANGTLIASAWRSEDPLPDLDAVPEPDARAAEATYPGLSSHPFPTCFACGTGREAGDGLRIFPGPMGADAEGRQRVAATWTPHPTVSDDDHHDPAHASLAATWAALDCPGGWAGDFGSRLMVLGEMTARIDTLPLIGETHVVVGVKRGAEGRRTLTATTLYDASGAVIGSAAHIWFAVDPGDFT